MHTCSLTNCCKGQGWLTRRVTMTVTCTTRDSDRDRDLHNLHNNSVCGDEAKTTSQGSREGGWPADAAACVRTTQMHKVEMMTNTQWTIKRPRTGGACRTSPC